MCVSPMTYVKFEEAYTPAQVMLVDLARNDVNRVCDPLTTRVDKLMVVQKV